LILLELCHRLEEGGGVHYFPSYEWISDELRDYRYYKEDGCHPNDLAIDFVPLAIEDGYHEVLLRYLLKRQALL
ncbi:MAG: hypothetical protein EBU82_15700, partial [Flavobacteriia bacterium]|nr:hypothetical protein [Flavobacteriia bacterium]